MIRPHFMYLPSMILTCLQRSFHSAINPCLRFTAPPHTLFRTRCWFTKISVSFSMQSRGDHRGQLTRPLTEIIIHILSFVMGEIDAYPLFGGRYSRLAVASPENGTDSRLTVALFPHLSFRFFPTGSIGEIKIDPCDSFPPMLKFCAVFDWDGDEMGIKDYECLLPGCLSNARHQRLVCC